jgi:hypothetical protein
MEWEMDWTFTWWSYSRSYCLVWVGLLEEIQVYDFVRMYFVILYCLMGIVHKKKATSRSEPTPCYRDIVHESNKDTFR